MLVTQPPEKTVQMFFCLALSFTFSKALRVLETSLSSGEMNPLPRHTAARMPWWFGSRACLWAAPDHAVFWAGGTAALPSLPHAADGAAAVILSLREFVDWAPAECSERTCGA